MFISKDATFEIDFYVKTIRNFKVHIVDDEALQKMPYLDQDSYKKHIITLKPMNWGANCDVRRAAIKTNPDTQMKEWDGETYNSEKLKRIIYSWSFVEEEDGKNVPVPVTNANIDCLHTKIGDYILDRYDDETEVTKDELKNS